jgi:microcystin-dependent protein
MAHMDTLRRIENNTPGTATDIDWNYQTLEAFVGGELIDRDGGVAMRSPLVGVDAVNSSEYATLGQVSALFFPGLIVDYGGSAAPAGWALCNGATQSATDPVYLPLFNVIGYTFGNPGGGNFNLPDLRDKSSVGVSGTKVSGSTGGNADLKAHIHTMGTHNHTQNSHTHTMGTHFHTMPTHFHTMGYHFHVTDINHDHASFTTSSGGPHNHNGGYLTTATGAGSNADLLRPHDASFSFQDQINTTNGEHTHSIDVPALGTNNKTSTSVDPGDTEATDPGDTYETDPGDTNTKTATNNAVDPGDTNSTGTGTDNYHPYLAVNKIIKL